MTQFPPFLNPLIGNEVSQKLIYEMTNRPFTYYGPDAKLHCALCTELPTLENKKAVFEETVDHQKGMAVTYTIHPKATWGDGTAVTTKDVLFTWEVGKNPEVGAVHHNFFANQIRSIEAVDDKTFTIHFNQRRCNFADIDALRLLPDHLERSIFEQNPKGYSKNTLYQKDPKNKGLYLGPYVISEIVPGEHLVLDQNPYWYGEKPYFKRIAVKIIENSAALEANFLAGSVDYIFGELGFNLDQALSLQKRQKDKYEFLFKDGLLFESIIVNLNNPILKDIKVRQALLYAIDREALVRQLFESYQPVARSNISPLDPDALTKPDLLYQQDIKKANQLLDEAGWKKDSKGMRFNAQNEPLRLTYTTTAGDRTRENVQQILQSQWRTVGIDVVIQNQPARVFFGETLPKAQFQLAQYANVSAPEEIPYTTLESNAIPTAENNWSGANYGHYSSPDMDRILEEMNKVCEGEANKKLWHDMQNLYLKDLPGLPLYFRADPYIFPKWLKNIAPTGHNDLSTLSIETWKVEE